MGLPGSKLRLREGETCENHPDVLAVVNIQGDTDSFGYEELPMCQECYDKFKEEIKEQDDTPCDWCHKKAQCKPMRDSDEGSHGPVYYVCSDCRARKRGEEIKELEYLLSLD